MPDRSFVMENNGMFCANHISGYSLTNFFVRSAEKRKQIRLQFFHDELIGCSMMLNAMVKPDIEVINTIV